MSVFNYLLVGKTEEQKQAIYAAFRKPIAAEAEKKYREFVAGLNRITDKDIEENERRRSSPAKPT